MSSTFNEFLSYLKKHDKAKSVSLVLSKLQNDEIDIPSLYMEILAPALNAIHCEDDDVSCIWKEHVQTFIVKTILECCYPIILKIRERENLKELGKKVMVVCPSQEYHDVGARMVCDFFTLVGFECIFIGANTPKEEIAAASKEDKPDIIAISVTNYYHLVELEKLITFLRDISGFKGKIIVGGNAFSKNPEIYKKLGADALLKSFDDIKKLAEEEN